MRPEFHPAAAEELATVAVAYEDHVGGLGRDFGAEVKRVAALLCDTPTIGEPLDPIHGALRIVAVAHRRRRPDYWRGRTFP